MSTSSSPDRTDPPQVSGERDSLDAWVDYHRATLLMKCAGLEPEQLATRSCPPSTLSLLGLVRHLTEVEAWFHDFDGAPEGEWYSTEEDPDACFNAVEPSRADADLAAYTASVERARAAVHGRPLDEVSPVPDDGRSVSLRWIYLHMIEEYARHNGHADLLRERIDGATGD
ncbi:MAG: DinB family protein [Actinomycetota bacterium]